MWGTDMTQTITVAEGRAYVFVAVEHANSEVVGIHARVVARQVGLCSPSKRRPARRNGLDGGWRH